MSLYISLYLRRILLAFVLSGSLLLLGLAATETHAQDKAWFWCVIHDNADQESRNFYSNVFQGVVDHKIRYERAFEAAIGARILKRRIQGEAICSFSEQPGELKREQNEYALNNLVTRGGTMEFINWSY